MTQPSRDLRIRRTEKLLQDALVELLKERHFDQITVSDLAERAMINRSTFYRHYQDKYDLVEKIFENVALTLNIAIGRPDRALDRIDGEQTPEPWLTFFEHFAANTHLYRALLGKNGTSYFAMRMREYTIGVMDERERLRTRLPGIKQGQESMPREVAIAFSANLLISTLTWWLESEPHYTAQEIATWFRRFLFFGYPRALGFDTIGSERNQFKES